MKELANMLMVLGSNIRAIRPITTALACLLIELRLKVTTHSNNRNSKSSREVILGSVRL